MGEVHGYFRELEGALVDLPLPQINQLIDLLMEAHHSGNRVFTLGNGGSASTASHFASDLSNKTRYPGGKSLRAIALTDNVPRITALANDEGYDNVFVVQLESLASEGDVLVALSASGRSQNVIRAVERARELGVFTVGITGGDGGVLKEKADISIVVPTRSTTHMEDLHLAVAHAVATSLATR